MKATVLLLSLFASFSSFACIDIGNELKICPNDTVFKGDTYLNGARVIAVNPSKQTVTVKSIYTGKLNVEAPRDLDITRGCSLGICVGDTVFKGDAYLNGARVIAVNPSKQSVTVKSIYTGKLNVEAPRDLDITRGCSLGICVGDTVFKGDTYLNGARVIAVNPSMQTVTVKSIYTGKLNVETPRDLDIIDLCLEFDSER